jgi:hypothetical protein
MVVNTSATSASGDGKDGAGPMAKEPVAIPASPGLHDSLDLVAETHVVGSSHSSIAPYASVADSVAREILARFWREVSERVSSPKVLTAVGQHQRAIEGMFAASMPDDKFAVHADRIAGAVLWYKTQMDSGAVPHGDFSKLPLFGVLGEQLSACWGRMVDLAGYYIRASKHQPDFAEFTNQYARRTALVESVWQRFAQNYQFPDDSNIRAEVSGRFFRGNTVDDFNQPTVAALLRHEFIQAAKLRLALELGGKQVQPHELDSYEPSIPVSFDFVDANRNSGMLPPNFKTMLALNRAIMAGGNGFLFCCPDYAREVRPDGTYNYTMDGLGTSCGLTAERSLPVAAALISRAAALEQNGQLLFPIKLRVGVADFEATEANARLTKCVSVDEFERRLGHSVSNIAARLVELLPTTLEIDISVDEAGHNIQERTLRVRDAHGQKDVAVVEIGRVTGSLLKDKIADENQRSTYFNELVEAKRTQLVQLAETVVPVQRQIDTLILLRMDLIVKWSGTEAPAYVQGLKSQVPIADKASVLRSMQAKLAAGDHTSEEAQALLYLRRKVAVQGAEYAVMHDLMKDHAHPYHLAADALNMWQVFGKKGIPLIGIRGLYAGADLVDLGAN